MPVTDTKHFRTNGSELICAGGEFIRRATELEWSAEKTAWDAASPHFMTRIRLTNGQVSAAQLKVIANVAEKYGRGVADITVRQNIQLHWIEAEALPDVLERLWRVGLTTQGSCGDDTRNITGCPLAGLDGEEYCDAAPLAKQLTTMLVGNSAFYNLPRKFKV